MPMLRLLSDGVGDLALAIRVGVNDIPAFRHGARAARVKHPIGCLKCM
jgi:hypothetical protein